MRLPEQRQEAVRAFVVFQPTHGADDRLCAHSGPPKGYKPVTAKRKKPEGETPAAAGPFTERSGPSKSASQVTTGFARLPGSAVPPVEPRSVSKLPSDLLSNAYIECVARMIFSAGPLR